MAEHPRSAAGAPTADPPARRAAPRRAHYAFARRVAQRLSRWAPVSVAAMLAGATLLAGCGNTIQAKAVANLELEHLVEVDRYPIYWLGSSFDGMPLTTVAADPSGAYTLQYGNCFVGGQEACLTPLEVISSPESTFLPAAQMPGAKREQIRSESGMVAQRGQVVEVATGPVVVEIRSRRRSIALAAAQRMAPINAPGNPGEALPAVVSDAAYLDKPLSSQQPQPLQMLPPVPRKGESGEAEPGPEEESE